MMTQLSDTQTFRPRCLYSAEFKARIVALCQQPGASVARIALDHQLNANMVRRWIQLAQTSRVTSAAAFVPLALPMQTGAPEASAPADTIRIEIPRPGGPVTIHWPVAQAASCVSLLRELLA